MPELCSSGDVVGMPELLLEKLLECPSYVVVEA
jgi:hypothetical protein